MRTILAVLAAVATAAGVMVIFHLPGPVPLAVGTAAGVSAVLACKAAKVECDDTRP